MSASHLTALSSYSLLQSTIKIPQYVQLAKKMGYKHLGITDRNNLYGALEFVKACQKEQIHPVIGLLLEYYSQQTQKEHEIFLFAKNNQGYKKLMHLSSQKMSGTQVLLEESSLTDLFAILPVENELTELQLEDEKIAKNRVTELQETFGKDQLFYGVAYQEALADEMNEWMQQQGVQAAAYQLIDSLYPEEAFSVKVMHHIREGEQIENLQQEMQEITSFKSLETAEKKAAWYETSAPQALQKTEMIAENCQAQIPLHQKLLPHYPIKDNKNASQYLKELCETKLPQRIAKVDVRYQERLDYELSVIHRMGFDDYFLIVWDVMDFLHENKIVTGAGRGSAAGSLTAYVLSITDVDPIKYDLLFERFLNPERNTMPDIDLDIPDNKRGEVLQYVKQKYGQNHAAQIATFGTMAAKMVLRDTSRVFGLSQSEANRWSNAIPKQMKITLEEAYDQSKALRELANMNERNKQLFQAAKTLEGLPRHVSTHAAGVVISDQDLLDLVPLQEGSEGIWLTQFTMNDVEETGLLKIDFLGLRNLSIIADTLQSIQKITKQNISQKDIPLDDKKTLRLFQKGDTTGVFQFESAGIRNVLRRLIPETIEDVAAVNALYRPGPMQNIDTFIKRKHGQEKIDYLDPSLAPILENTYGVIVYQEQIMQIASQMAGFTLGQADILRRAISKKKKSVLDKQRRYFIEGAQNKGFTQEKANQMYDYIERFADYGFNRSHAFAYSFVAFQMAYLKVHYPAPFYKALLRSVLHTPKKLKEYLSDAKNAGVKVLNPSINQSAYSFYLNSLQEIRFGLGSIKGIRRDFIYDILAERRENGNYASLNQFLTRMNQYNSKWLKEENIRPLIAIGAFDELEENRRQAISQLEGKIQNVVYSGGSLDLLDMMALKNEALTDFSLEEKLNLEEQYLGIYLSGHPVEQFEKIKQRKKVTDISELVENTTVNLLIYGTEIREIRTKKGEQMAFLEGNDPTDETSVTIFPRLYRKVRNQLEENQVYYIEGKVEKNKYNDQLQVIANQVVVAKTLADTIADKTAYLKIPAAADQKQLVASLHAVIKQFRGNVPIIIYYEKTGETRLLPEKNWVTYTKDLQNSLEEIIGSGNVVFK
ncbi:DNA-directed DNA polymerase [Tetragenococcus halophilus subsp. flandriensis]|uniref:DNA polymerase III subunit alpha n=1 Tax=Tetragenococcus halophilus TaxID=51669 RepID=UPI0023E925EC|nr:DNA polymerase III subunit alpha [Tetragenococcus halophilus]GMA09448.1 DNA-directed DNA polymerase [Tetragenococcus halophilus subsp. flandriensis]